MDGWLVGWFVCLCVCPQANLWTGILLEKCWATKESYLVPIVEMWTKSSFQAEKKRFFLLFVYIKEHVHRRLSVVHHLRSDLFSWWDQSDLQLRTL